MFDFQVLFDFHHETKEKEQTNHGEKLLLRQFFVKGFQGINCSKRSSTVKEKIEGIKVTQRS